MKKIQLLPLAVLLFYTLSCENPRPKFKTGDNPHSIKDSELLKSYVFTIDSKSRCDNFGKFGESVSCFLRSREGKLYFFSYNKNRLEIMNLAGDGTRYINIKP